MSSLATVRCSWCYSYTNDCETSRCEYRTHYLCPECRHMNVQESIENIHGIIFCHLPVSSQPLPIQPIIRRIPRINIEFPRRSSTCNGCDDCEGKRFFFHTQEN